MTPVLKVALERVVHDRFECGQVKEILVQEIMLTLQSMAIGTNLSRLLQITNPFDGFLHYGEILWI